MTHSDHWKVLMTTALYTSNLLPTVNPNPFQYLPTKSTISTLLFLVRKIEANFFAPFRRVCAILMDWLHHSQITMRRCQLLRNSEQFRFLTYLQNTINWCYWSGDYGQSDYVANVLCPYVFESSNTQCSNKNFHTSKYCLYVIHSIQIQYTNI